MSSPIENGHVSLVKEFPDQVISSLEPAENTDWDALEKETEDILRSLVKPAGLAGLEAGSPLERMLHHPLLIHEEELVLGRQIQAARSISPDNPDYEAARAAGKAAKDKLVEHNFLLVQKWALKYAAGGKLPAEDLFQEGNTGLMKAADKFDPNRNIKFSTYASWWIRQTIIRAIQDQSAMIRRPGHIRSMEADVLKAKEQIDLANKEGVLEGVTPSSNYETIAREANKIRASRLTRMNGEAKDPKEPGTGPIKSNHARLVLNAARVVTSTDIPLPHLEGGLTLADLHPDETESVEDLAVENADNALILDLLDSLLSRDRIVLRKRFGFEDGKEKTLEEIGRELGVSRERVRQIEAGALKRLKGSPIIQKMGRERLGVKAYRFTPTG